MEIDEFQGNTYRKREIELNILQESRKMLINRGQNDQNSCKCMKRHTFF